MCIQAQSLTCAQLFVTLWTVTLQALLSMGFSRQENWSELPFPCPGIFPSQGLNPRLPHWQAVFFFLPLGSLGKLKKALKVPQKIKPGPSHLQGYHNLGKGDRGPELVSAWGEEKKEIN